MKWIELLAWIPKANSDELYVVCKLLGVPRHQLPTYVRLRALRDEDGVIPGSFGEAIYAVAKPKMGLVGKIREALGI